MTIQPNTILAKIKILAMSFYTPKLSVSALSLQSNLTHRTTNRHTVSYQRKVTLQPQTSLCSYGLLGVGGITKSPQDHFHIHIKYLRTQLNYPWLLDILTHLPKMPFACKTPVQISNHPRSQWHQCTCSLPGQFLDKSLGSPTCFEKVLNETSKCSSSMVDSLLQGVLLLLKLFRSWLSNSLS